VRGELAARRLGADLAQLRAALAGRTHDPREHHAPRGLRLDQAAAAWHALTSARTVEVITGPAGTGKTRVLAAITRNRFRSPSVLRKGCLGGVNDVAVTGCCVRREWEL